MKKEKPVQMGQESNLEGWFDGEKYIPFEKMTTTHLRRAHMYAQRQELKYFNKMGTLTALIEKLEDEAARRKIKLKTYKSEFHKKKTDWAKKSAEVDNV